MEEMAALAKTGSGPHRNVCVNCLEANEAKIAIPDDRTFETEGEANGLRQNEFCRNHGLALSTLQRQLKGPVGPSAHSLLWTAAPYLARFQTSRAVPDPSDVVAVVHFSSPPEIVKGRF